MGLLDWIRTKTVDNPPVVYGEVYEENENHTEPEQEQYHEEPKKERKFKKDYSFNSVYNFVVFAPFIDTDKIVGKDTPYYTPETSAMALYLRDIWNTSKKLLEKDNVYPKIFFEDIEHLEDILYNCPYSIKNYKPLYEQAEYERRKEQIIIDFLNRSFKDCFRNALELKTVKGRINHMENWFMKMKYYRLFMNEKEQYILDNLYIQWVGEYKGIAEK